MNDDMYLDIDVPCKSLLHGSETTDEGAGAGHRVRRIRLHGQSPLDSREEDHRVQRIFRCSSPHKDLLVVNREYLAIAIYIMFIFIKCCA
jgi:hypothetical protein